MHLFLTDMNQMNYDTCSNTRTEILLIKTEALFIRLYNIYNLKSVILTQYVRAIVGKKNQLKPKLVSEIVFFLKKKN